VKLVCGELVETAKRLSLFRVKFYRM